MDGSSTVAPQASVNVPVTSTPAPAAPAVPSSGISPKPKTKTSGGLLSKLLIVVPLVLLLGVFAYLGYKVYGKSYSEPQNVRITNVTDRSVTVSWETEKPTQGVVIADTEDSFKPWILASQGKSMYFDDRDMNEEELLRAQELVSKNANNEELETSEIQSITDPKEYYTHHVTVTNLEPETTYYFMVGNGVRFAKTTSVMVNDMFTSANESTFATFAELENLSTPNPTYGSVESAGSVVDDGVLFMIVSRKEDDGTTTSSVPLSAPINNEGRWYVDLSNARSFEGGEFVELNEDEDVELVYVMGGQFGVSETVTIPMSADAPAGTIELFNGSGTEESRSLVSIVNAENNTDNCCNDPTWTQNNANNGEPGCQGDEFSAGYNACQAGACICDPSGGDDNEEGLPVEGNYCEFATGCAGDLNCCLVTENGAPKKECVSGPCPADPSGPGTSCNDPGACTTQADKDSCCTANKKDCCYVGDNCGGTYDCQVASGQCCTTNKNTPGQFESNLCGGSASIKCCKPATSGTCATGGADDSDDDNDNQSDCPTPHTASAPDKCHIGEACQGVSGECIQVPAGTGATNDYSDGGRHGKLLSGKCHGSAAIMCFQATTDEGECAPGQTGPYGTASKCTSACGVYSGATKVASIPCVSGPSGGEKVCCPSDSDVSTSGNGSGSCLPGMVTYQDEDECKGACTSTATETKLCISDTSGNNARCCKSTPKSSVSVCPNGGTPGVVNCPNCISCLPDISGSLRCCDSTPVPDDSQYEGTCTQGRPQTNYQRCKDIADQMLADDGIECECVGDVGGEASAERCLVCPDIAEVPVEAPEEGSVALIGKGEQCTSSSGCECPSGYGLYQNKYVPQGSYCLEVTTALSCENASGKVCNYDGSKCTSTTVGGNTYTECAGAGDGSVDTLLQGQQCGDNDGCECPNGYGEGAANSVEKGQFCREVKQESDCRTSSNIGKICKVDGTVCTSVGGGTCGSVSSAPVTIGKNEQCTSGTGCTCPDGFGKSYGKYVSNGEYCLGVSPQLACSGSGSANQVCSFDGTVCKTNNIPSGTVYTCEGADGDGVKDGILAGQKCADSDGCTCPSGLGGGGTQNNSISINEYCLDVSTCTSSDVDKICKNDGTRCIADNNGSCGAAVPTLSGNQKCSDPDGCYCWVGMQALTLSSGEYCPSVSESGCTNTSQMCKRDGTKCKAYGTSPMYYDCPSGSSRNLTLYSGLTGIVGRALASDVYAAETENYLVTDNYYVIPTSEGVYDIVIPGVGVAYGVKLTSGQQHIFYTDTNGNGVRDDDEEVIDIGANPLNLSVDTSKTVSTLSLVKGYNYLSFDYLPVKSDSCELIKDLSSLTGGQVTLLARFESGAFQVTSYRADAGSPVSGDCFPVVPGRGYVVRSFTTQEISIEGYDLQAPASIGFDVAGWHLVGVNGSSTNYTAESLLDSVDAVGEIDVDNVTTWRTGASRYEGLQKENSEVYGFDFPIETGIAYFVRVASGSGVWTPE